MITDVKRYLIQKPFRQVRKNIVVTEFLVIAGMTLAGSWSVVSNAHIQPVTLLMVLELLRSRSVVGGAHIQAFTFFMVLELSRSRSVVSNTHIQAFNFSQR